MERRKWSFAIVGVAAARFEDGVRLGLAGVAPIPWALSSLDALEQATPLPGTAYKVQVARALIRRAVEAVGAPART
jgi:xanthine dehydrogenase YagS FAD-binding subunit